MQRSLALSVAFLLLAARAASAQSTPGLAVDMNVHSPTGPDTSTNIVHMTATATAVRMEFEKRPQNGQFRGLPIGDHGAIIMRNAGSEMILLDQANKQYMSIKPLEMMEGAHKMMESMGGSITFDSSGSTISVDSLGPGPVIDGHKTLRYRVTGRTKVTIAMMGQVHTVETQLVSESEMAADLADLVAAVPGISGFRDTFQSMSQSIGLPKSFLDKATHEQQKVRGFALHTEKQTTIVTDNNTRTNTEISDAKNIRRASIPDSAFAVPVGYKLMPFPFAPPRPTP
jgi:hypothetical protein